MKIKWLVADVTAVGSTNREEHDFFGCDFGWTFFWQIQAVFVVGELLCGVGTPS